jgi:hypothetical protein
MLLQVLKDMHSSFKRETGRKLGRAAVATSCATTLAMPSVATATEPEGPEPSTAQTSEELNPQAQKHATKAIEHFKNGAFVDSEEEFRRVAFFAPNWRPLHFNLAVLAEAQGKIGVAVREYKEFRPYATPDEGLLVDQRIYELTERRKRIIRSYRGQRATGAIIVSLGLAGIAGGIALLGVFYSRDPEVRKEKPGPAVGGFLLILYGVLVAGGGAVPLSKAVKAKRELDGLALGPTRLKWNGGAGFTLKF